MAPGERPGVGSAAMRTALFALVAVAALLPARALGQVHVEVRIPLPELPRLVVVQPGVQVVEDFDDEVFVHGGVYWMRRGPTWYRASGPRAAFVVVQPRLVPVALVRLPPGHYRHWKAERRAERRHEKAVKKAEKRHEHREHEHGKHRGHGRD
jgi:hypothetical protein